VSQKWEKCHQSGGGNGGFGWSSRLNPWRGICLQQVMKTVVNKVKRSGVYYLMTTVASTDETKSARSDTWGILVVVLLLLGVVGLMRLLLTV
jgi:hypothetical protein